MEENTMTEQYLELDEEQLQAITGAVDDRKSFTADHLKKASDAIRMSDLARANGLHPIGEGFAEEAAVHIDKVNTMIKDENAKREIERKSAWPTIQWK